MTRDGEKIIASWWTPGHLLLLEWVWGGWWIHHCGIRGWNFRKQ